MENLKKREELYSRSTAVELERESTNLLSYLNNEPLVKQLLDAVQIPVIILNSKREIIFSNDSFITAIGTPLSDLVGKRPGEALLCENFLKGTTGCGTSSHCAVCDMGRCASHTMEKAATEECECSIVSLTGQYCDFKLKSQAITVGGERYSLLSLLNISDQKYRQMLERVFLHDIQNTSGALEGFTELLTEMKIPEANEFLTKISRIGHQLSEEIKSHIQMLEAESGDLKPHCAPINIDELLSEVVVFFKSKESFNKTKLIAESILVNKELSSDKSLLMRVLINLVKNAIESSSEGEPVTIRIEERHKNILFSIHNNREIPKEVQHNLFRKSFSTKGANRGYGTYSIKLFGEKYLKGSVSYTTAATKGTTFTLELPRQIQ